MQLGNEMKSPRVGLHFALDSDISHSISLLPLQRMKKGFSGQLVLVVFFVACHFIAIAGSSGSFNLLFLFSPRLSPTILSSLHHYLTPAASSSLSLLPPRSSAYRQSLSSSQTSCMATETNERKSKRKKKILTQ